VSDERRAKSKAQLSLSFARSLSLSLCLSLCLSLSLSPPLSLSPSSSQRRLLGRLGKREKERRVPREGGGEKEKRAV